MLLEKIIESIIRDIIEAYMNEYNPNSDCHGFCEHRSCHSVAACVEDLSNMFDNGDPYDIIYPDLKKLLIRSHIKDWL